MKSLPVLIVVASLLACSKHPPKRSLEVGTTPTDQPYTFVPYKVLPREAGTYLAPEVQDQWHPEATDAACMQSTDFEADSFVELAERLHVDSFSVCPGETIWIHPSNVGLTGPATYSKSK